jgi:hypothetical protein
MRTRKLVGLAAAVLALAGIVLPVVHAEETDPNKSPALCATGDTPEPGMQGEVPAGLTPEWNCGVREVGQLAGANGAMAVAAHCAYTGGGLENAPSGNTGVRVIDVSDPTQPKQTTVLDTSSRELLAARVYGDRAILATRHRDTEAQDGQVVGRDMLVDVWDIRTCTDPLLLGTLRFPTASRIHGDPPAETGGPVHTVAINLTATKIYGTIPLQEADVTDLYHPEHWTVRDLHCQVSNQHYAPYQLTSGVPVCDTLQGTTWTYPSNSHQVGFSPDGSRMFIGSQIPGPSNNAMYILDITSGDPKVVSVTEQEPGHSIDFATIDGRRYLLHANEIGGTACIPEAQRPRYVGMGDRAWLLDITDEKAPVDASEMLMAVSKFENCDPSRPTGPSTAFHDVNDPLDSRWAVIGFGSAGFRVFDIRDAKNPVEVAYFNYGASEHTKPYIIPGTNRIWVSDAGGFRVLELESQVVDDLGLGQPPASCVPDHANRKKPCK